ncbi:uncharacterized protein BDW70DRAFT_157542 [Aspergillus foveolatus]|uniref:uncharacterized protein n=1 Tax=Aspergillus foveolatus TaxID=210207 RepID=UPI003CCE0972
MPPKRQRTDYDDDDGHDPSANSDSSTEYLTVVNIDAPTYTITGTLTEATTDTDTPASPTEVMAKVRKPYMQKAGSKKAAKTLAKTREIAGREESRLPPEVTGRPTTDDTESWRSAYIPGPSEYMGAFPLENLGSPDVRSPGTPSARMPAQPNNGRSAPATNQAILLGNPYTQAPSPLTYENTGYELYGLATLPVFARPDTMMRSKLPKHVAKAMPGQTRAREMFPPKWIKYLYRKPEEDSESNDDADFDERRWDE